MKKKKSFFYGLTFNIIAAIAVLLLVFCVVVCVIGYYKFTDSLTKEYTDSAYRTAETATTLVDADNIDAYLLNSQSILNQEDTDLSREYYQSLERLNILREKQNVTIIYIIAVDTTDYEHFTSVFNCPDKSVYKTVWNIGEVKYTTQTSDNTYQKIYKDMYEKSKKSASIMRTTNLNGAPPHVTSLIPLYKTDGTVAALMCVQRPMSELVNGRKSYMYLVASFTLAFAVLLMTLSALFMRKQIINPIKKINAEAARFAEKNCAPDTPCLGNLSKINEISELASSISEMEEETLKYIDNLSTAISEKQRMGTELRIASLIQQGSLPSVFPAFPERKEFDLYASMSPAKEVGGDFYDFFLIDDDRLALVIADVSGKGVPAAVFMMATKILINERAHVDGTPAEILSVVNDRICEHNSAEMFVTVWLGILEISTGKLTFANAGHDDPAVSVSGGDFDIVKSKHGFVIGGMSGVKYKDSEIVLNKGDKIFLYTDGVPEATDKDNKLFTAQRMLDALNIETQSAPETVIKTVRKKVEEFTGDAPQFDDITMLCLEYKGKSENNIKLKATDENLHKATKFISKCLKDTRCTEKFVRQVELYVEEIFVNVAHYAYAPNIGDIEISCEVFADKIRVTFIDEGKNYNPLDKPDPDVTLSAAEREIGGLGIFMTKKLTDKIEYEYKDGKNILITEKNFE